MADNFTTNLSELSAVSQSSIKRNAAAQGISPEEYLASRGGVNPVTNKFADSVSPYDLTNEQYLTAVAGKTGVARGQAINAATSKNQYNYLISLGRTPEDAAAISGYAPEGITPSTTLKSSNINTGSSGTGTGAVTTTGGLTSAQMDVRSALDEFTSVLNSVGLGDLAKQMDTWIKENRQPAEIKTLVRTSKSYTDRFPGMAALSAKNQAISEGQYIDLERGFTEILNAYGLDTQVFGSRSALGGYISNQVSAREFEERVNDAAVRVEQQPDVLAALTLYHGIDKSTAIAYLLDPKLGMDLVRKQVRAAEIGAAAMGAGFTQFGIPGTTGKDVAESYVSQIGTEDLQTLKKEFGAAAILAQTQGRLASIEGQAYSADQAIQAAVVGNQQAGLESQRRAAREAARFGGQGSFITRESTAGLI